MGFSQGVLHLIALASIGLGVVYCFFGYRIFRIVLAILGLISDTSMAAAIAFEIFGGESAIAISISSQSQGLATYGRARIHYAPVLGSSWDSRYCSTVSNYRRTKE